MDGEWLLVVDKVEGTQYDSVGFPVFSPDSQHVAYLATVGEKQLIVVDGLEGKPYDIVPGEVKIIFDSSNSLRYLGRDSDRVFLVREDLK
jgi:hypothetical protein